MRIQECVSVNLSFTTLTARFSTSRLADRQFKVGFNREFSSMPFFRTSWKPLSGPSRVACRSYI